MHGMGRAPFVQNAAPAASALIGSRLPPGSAAVSGRSPRKVSSHNAPCRPGSRLRYAVVFDTRLSAFVVVAAGHVAGPRKSLWRLLCRTPMMVVGDITTSPEAFNAGRSARYPPL